MAICRMVRIACVLFAITACWPVMAEEFISGEVMDTDGHATKVSRFLEVASPIISGKYKGNALELYAKDVTRIEALGNGIFRVTNKADKVFELENARMGYTYNKGYTYARTVFPFMFYNDISMKEERQEYQPSKVKMVIVQGELGRLRFNERTKTYFPPDYVFDPFTGEKLIWKNPEY